MLVLNFIINILAFALLTFSIIKNEYHVIFLILLATKILFVFPFK